MPTPEDLEDLLSFLMLGRFEHHKDGKPEDCPQSECAICAVKYCPHGDFLHYHHDGCPSCWREENEARAKQTPQ